MSCQFTLEQHIEHHAILGTGSGGNGGVGVGESTTVSPPLILDGYNISMPPATDGQDGYMTASDHQLLIDIQSTAPSSPFAGQQWYDTVDDELYLYDGYRAKFLSPNVFTVSATRNAGNSSNLYLRASDGAPTNQAPYVLPFDATLVAMSASCNTAGTWLGEVHLSLSLVPGAALSVAASTTAFASLFNIDFSAGDAVQLFLNGASIDRPRVNLFFARRGS